MNEKFIKHIKDNIKPDNSLIEKVRTPISKTQKFRWKLAPALMSLVILSVSTYFLFTGLIVNRPRPSTNPDQYFNNIFINQLTDVVSSYETTSFDSVSVMISSVEFNNKHSHLKISGSYTSEEIIYYPEVEAYTLNITDSKPNNINNKFNVSIVNDRYYSSYIIGYMIEDKTIRKIPSYIDGKKVYLYGIDNQVRFAYIENGDSYISIETESINNEISSLMSQEDFIEFFDSFLLLDDDLRPTEPKENEIYLNSIYFCNYSIIDFTYLDDNHETIDSERFKELHPELSINNYFETSWGLYYPEIESTHFILTKYNDNQYGANSSDYNSYAITITPNNFILYSSNFIFHEEIVANTPSLIDGNLWYFFGEDNNIQIAYVKLNDKYIMIEPYFSENNEPLSTNITQFTSFIKEFVKSNSSN